MTDLDVYSRREPGEGPGRVRRIDSPTSSYGGRPDPSPLCVCLSSQSLVTFRYKETPLRYRFILEKGGSLVNDGTKPRFVSFCLSPFEDSSSFVPLTDRRMTRHTGYV